MAHTGMLGRDGRASSRRQMSTTSFTALLVCNGRLCGFLFEANYFFGVYAANGTWPPQRTAETGLRLTSAGA